jgi:hypothetical protein
MFASQKHENSLTRRSWWISILFKPHKAYACKQSATGSVPAWKLNAMTLTMRRRTPVKKGPKDSPSSSQPPPQLTPTDMQPSSTSTILTQNASSTEQSLQKGHVSVWQGQSSWEHRMLQGPGNTPNVAASKSQIAAADSRSSSNAQAAISARQSSRSQSQADTTPASLTSPTASKATLSDSSSRCGIGIRVKFSGKGENTITVPRLKHPYSPPPPPSSPSKVWAGWWSPFGLVVALLSVFRSER